MWLVLNDTFLSFVAYRVTPAQPDKLMVRARVKGDIDKVFPGVPVTFTPDADYAYRAVVTRACVAAMVTQEVMAIDYVNFKDSVAEGDRHDTYMEFWCAMLRLQRARLNPKRKQKGQQPQPQLPATWDLWNYDDGVDPLVPRRLEGDAAPAQARPVRKKRSGKRGRKSRANGTATATKAGGLEKDGIAARV